jgi:signal transduction histidine kinase
MSDLALRRYWRGVAVARVGMLALVIALSGSARNLVDRWWWLGALALVAVAATAGERVLPPTRLRAAGEMIMASVVIGVGLPDAYLALPYLLLPAFAGGLAAGIVGAAMCTGAAALGLTLGVTLSRNEPPELAAFSSLTAWMLIIFVTGCIGAWLLRQELRQTGDATRYAATYRLLSELRLISSQLSSGLEPTSLADRLLADVTRILPTRRAALLVRSEGGTLVQLARRGDGANWLAAIEHDPTVLEAWSSELPHRTLTHEQEHRVVLPLRVGARTIGAVVADVPGGVSRSELRSILRSVDDGAVRLDTALLFEEVRELAIREERLRLAREIHDGIAQELASIGYLVDELMARAARPDTKALAATLRRELTRILSELRHSIFDLRIALDLEKGLGAALSSYARQVGTQTGLKIHLAHEESHERLRPEVEAELLRIGQEAITNVRKHAKARNLWLTVTVTAPAAHIRVVDDGAGGTERGDGRYGLEIMAERARRIGATLVIEQAPQGGTVVDVALSGTHGER